MIKNYLTTFYISFKRKLKFFLKFYLPNLFAFKRITYQTKPNCDQKTLITGAGKVIIGEKCKFGFRHGGFFRNGYIEIQPREKKAIIKIGNGVVTNNNIFMCASNYIEIGDETLIGQNVSFMDTDGHMITPSKRKEVGEIGEIIIGKNVWIGSNVLILKNTKIGINSIVAAGAVVKGNFPSNVIIGGVPAKIIKTI